MTHYNTGALLEKTHRDERRGGETRPVTEDEDEERWTDRKKKDENRTVMQEAKTHYTGD